MTSVVYISARYVSAREPFTFSPVFWWRFISLALSYIEAVGENISTILIYCGNSLYQVRIWREGAQSYPQIVRAALSSSSEAIHICSQNQLQEYVLFLKTLPILPCIVLKDVQHGLPEATPSVFLNTQISLATFIPLCQINVKND